MTGLDKATVLTFVLTSDRGRAQPFYADVIGLPVVNDDMFAVTFALAGGATMRLTDLPGHEAHPHTVLGWEVPNIAAAIAALRDKGARFEIYEGFDQDADGVWTAPGGDARIAWFKDPDGNVLSLTQF